MAKFNYFKINLRLLSIISLFIIFITYSTSAIAEQTDDWRWNNIDRVVVVPDIHGAFPAFTRLLQANSLVDNSLHWIGGKTHLVSLGDLLDRGAESRKVMDLLMRLQKEAQVAGGYVHVVAGNHELMNLIGDLRYVAKAEYLAFAIDETTDMRNQAFQKFLTTSSQAFESEQAARDAFDIKFPSGYLAHRKAFSTDGVYGRWLLSLPAIVVINDIAYAHAGLPELVTKHSLNQLNQELQNVTTRYIKLWHELVDLNILPNDENQDAETLAHSMLQNALPSDCINSRKESCEQLKNNGSVLLSKEHEEKIKEFINVSQSPIIGVDGPLWSRGAIYCRELFERPILNASMNKLGVKQVVVGHTTTPDSRAHSLHNNTLTVLDTGMLVEYYNGRPASLVIEDGQQIVHYLDPDEQSPPIRNALPDAYKLTDAEIETVLQNGGITVLSKPSGAQLGVGGAWKVVAQHNNNKINALFYPHDREDQDRKELAANALDDLLGFELIPITVGRTIENTKGALQLSFPGTLNEKSRLESNAAVGGWCPLPRQYQLMHVWDILTENSGRSVENLYYRTDFGLIYLTEHVNAFGINKRLPKKLRKDALKLNPEIRQSLASLNTENLQAALGANIDDKAIYALLKRRDAMLRSLK